MARPDAQVTLVGVVTPLLDAPFGRAQETEIAAQMERARPLLWQDLETRARPLRARGLHVVTTVRTGDITAEILACARETNADLIILATQSTSGLSRWMLGSVARRLLHAAALPTLVVRSHAGLVHADTQIGGVIVPLDGSPLAEASLPIADTLAARFGVPLRIIRVVPNRPQRRHLPATNDAMAVHRLGVEMERAYAAAARYVQSMIDRVRDEGRDVSGEVRVGDPATTLSAFLAENPSALVVMATRGAGDDGAAFDSIAEKIVAAAPNPALIVRPLAGKSLRLRHDPALAARYPD